MALAEGKQHWAWLALCAVPAAASLALAPSAAYAAPATPQEVKAAYTAWQLEVGKIVEDLNAFRNGLPSTFKCPPASPNKDEKLAELTALSNRLGRARVRARQIEDQRTLLGKAGEGQGSSAALDELKRRSGLGTPNDLIVTDADMKAVNDRINRTATQIGQLRQQINNSPPSRKECDPKTDPIATVNFNAPSDEPGKTVTANISATTASGNALTISGVTVGGINEVGNAVGAPGGLGTANATYKFKIADVRRHGPFPLRVTVSGLPPGFSPPVAPLTRTITVNYEVKNVAPKVTKVPDSPKAKPGEKLSLDGKVEVVDKNADNRNAGEVRVASVNLAGHPAGLETAPANAFSRFSTITQDSHDPDTGTYIFSVKREADAKKPHPHGKFATKISAADSKGETGEADIEFIIENVAPTITVKAEDQHFHSGDGKTFTIKGKVTDDNGADDIEEIDIDASKAVGGGGGIFKLSAGSVVKINPQDDGYDYRINPAQTGHTDTKGKWQIDATVKDGGAPEQGSPTPLTAKGDTFITVENLAPDSNAYGYLSNLGMAPGKKDVCPRELIRVGILVRDPEGDALTVTAVIRETGDKTVLTLAPGDSTHTGDMLAPGTPGTYHIDFVIEEVKTAIVKVPNKVTKTIELEVKPCDDDKEDEPRAALDPPKPPDVAIKGPPGSEVKIGAIPPVLPGELPSYLPMLIQYGQLLQTAILVDNFYKTVKAVNSTLPPLSQMVLNTFWQQYLLDQKLKVMEDGGNHPDGTCGAGNGEGPVLADANAAKNAPPLLSPANFLAWLISEQVKKANEAGARIDGSIKSDNFDIKGEYKWQLNDAMNLQLKAEYKDWVDDIKTEQGQAAPYTIDPAALRAGLNWKIADNWGLQLGAEYNDWGKDIQPGSGTLGSNPYAGFLHGLTLQEGYIEAAPQTTLDGNGRGAIRYVSPTIAGFTLSSQWGEDDMWDAALRYAGEFGNIRVAAGVGYADSHGGPNGTPSTAYTSPTIAGFIKSAELPDDDWSVALRYAGEFGSFRVAAGAGYATDAGGLDKQANIDRPASNPLAPTSGASGATGVSGSSSTSELDKFGQALDRALSEPSNTDAFPGATLGGPIIKDKLWFFTSPQADTTGGLSAEYGRFTGGVVNVITRSSARGDLPQVPSTSTYINDRWQLNDKWSFNLGVRYEETEDVPSGGQSGFNWESISPRIGFTGGGPSYGWFYDRFKYELPRGSFGGPALGGDRSIDDAPLTGLGDRSGGSRIRYDHDFDSFGFSLSNDPNPIVSGSKGSDSAGFDVFLSGNFGTITMGDTDSAFDWALRDLDNLALEDSCRVKKIVPPGQEPGQ